MPTCCSNSGIGFLDPVTIATIGSMLASHVTTLFGLRKSPAQKIAATEIVEAAIRDLDKLLELWEAEPSKTVSVQAAYLDYYDRIITALVEACSDPSLGSAGQRCISDRLGPGAKWPLDEYYRARIAEYPATQDTVSGIIENTIDVSGEWGWVYPLLGGALLLYGLIVTREIKG